MTDLKLLPLRFYSQKASNFMALEYHNLFKSMQIIFKPLRIKIHPVLRYEHVVRTSFI